MVSLSLLLLSSAVSYLGNVTAESTSFYHATPRFAFGHSWNMVLPAVMGMYAKINSAATLWLCKIYQTGRLLLPKHSNKGCFSLLPKQLSVCFE